MHYIKTNQILMNEWRIIDKKNNKNTQLSIA